MVAWWSAKSLAVALAIRRATVPSLRASLLRDSSSAASGLCLTSGAPRGWRLLAVLIGGALMRAGTVSIAIALVFVPVPAAAFDQDEFCTTITDIARRMNARVGRWLDRSTRLDGVVVDCGLKTLETKRFLKTDPDEMREGWEARKQRAWNTAYCNNEAWRDAVDNGWSIISTLTFRTGETMSFVAEC